MTSADEHRVLEVVPGRSIGPFEIGMTEESPPADCLETSREPGVDEVELAAGLGLGARLGSVALLGRLAEDVLADLEREGVEPPRPDPEDPDSHHARGWSLWAPEGIIVGVVVERPEFFDEPPDLLSRTDVYV